MAVVPQTYYKDWVNGVAQSNSYNFADSIEVQFDQGKEDILVTVNGKTGLFDKVTGTGSYYEYIYAHDYTSRVHNFVVRNMSNESLIMNINSDELGDVIELTLGVGDVLSFTGYSVAFSKDNHQFLVYRWATPAKNGGIINLNWGNVDFDKTALAKVFDRYYAYWFINDPYDEGFLNVLQDQYDRCKEQIDRHYAYIQTMSVSPTQTETYEFGNKKRTEGKGARTDKSTYGARDTEDKSFDYPINADLNQASPSKGEKSTQSQVVDQTEYGKQDNTTIDDKYQNDVKRVNNTDPVKAIKDADKLYSFQQYFIDCFTDCFTLFESMTW